MKRVVVACMGLLPALASAHTGLDAGAHHGSALVQGFVHPFTGLDHLLAMLMVGVWSVLSFQQTGPRMWSLPAAFSGFLVIGALMGLAGFKLPLVEPMIGTSLLAFGLLVAWRETLPLVHAVGMVALFALAHGVAHGSELPPLGLVGMIAGTVLLHFLGMALARYGLAQSPWASRLAGLAVAAFGSVALLVSW